MRTKEVLVSIFSIGSMKAVFLTIKYTQVTPDKKVTDWWIFMSRAVSSIFVQIFDTFVSFFKCLCITYYLRSFQFGNEERKN